MSLSNLGGTVATGVVAAAIAAAAIVAAGSAAAQTIPQPNFGNRTDNRDGTAAVTVGRILSQTDDARVGLDWTLARDLGGLPAGPMSPLPAAGDPSAGAAWARLALPGWGWDRMTVEARLVPFQEQARFAATASRKLPVADGFEMSLESGYAVVSRYAVAAGAEAPAQTLESTQRVGLRYAPTDTSLAVVRSYSSDTHQWLQAVSAEQKLFGGPIHLTAAVSENADGTRARSIAASFRREF